MRERCYVQKAIWAFVSLGLTLELVSLIQNSWVGCNILIFQIDARLDEPLVREGKGFLDF
jgi:low affinity Fe/Cu permease